MKVGCHFIGLKWLMIDGVKGNGCNVRFLFLVITKNRKSRFILLL